MRAELSAMAKRITVQSSALENEVQAMRQELVTYQIELVALRRSIEKATTVSF